MASRSPSPTPSVVLATEFLLFQLQEMVEGRAPPPPPPMSSPTVNVVPPRMHLENIIPPPNVAAGLKSLTTAGSLALAGVARPRTPGRRQTPSLPVILDGNLTSSELSDSEIPHTPTGPPLRSTPRTTPRGAPTSQPTPQPTPPASPPASPAASLPASPTMPVLSPTLDFSFSSPAVPLTVSVDTSGARNVLSAGIAGTLHYSRGCLGYKKVSSVLSVSGLSRRAEKSVPELITAVTVLSFTRSKKKPQKIAVLDVLHILRGRAACARTGRSPTPGTELVAVETESQLYIFEVGDCVVLDSFLNALSELLQIGISS